MVQHRRRPQRRLSHQVPPRQLSHPSTGSRREVVHRRRSPVGRLVAVGIDQGKIRDVAPQVFGCWDEGQRGEAQATRPAQEDEPETRGAPNADVVPEVEAPLKPNPQ